MCLHFTGHEFCLELRKTVPDAVVPVIMVSAKNDEANIVEGLTHGCNDFVRCAQPARPEHAFSAGCTWHLQISVT